MIYSTKLKSGESIISSRKGNNLEDPFVTSVENNQLVMIPWPEFMKDRVRTIEIDPSHIVYSFEAEEQVVKQYNYLLEAETN